MKIVMVVNKDLPAGLVANATAVLGITLGRQGYFEKEISRLTGSLGLYR